MFFGYSSFLLLVCAAFVPTLASASHMHLQTLFADKSQELRSVLPDGRTHIKFEAMTHIFSGQKTQPFANAEFSHLDLEGANEATRKSIRSMSTNQTMDPDVARVHLKYEATMKKKWDIVDLSQHMADLSEQHLVCVDDIDFHPHGARVIMKRPSAELVAKLLQRSQNTVLVLPPHLHQCHGVVFFRRVLAAAYDQQRSILHATTGKVQYTDIFDELDVDLVTSRLVVTHPEQSDHALKGSRFYSTKINSAVSSPFERPPPAEIEAEYLDDKEEVIDPKFFSNNVTSPSSWWSKREEGDMPLVIFGNTTARRHMKAQGFWKKLKKAAKKAKNAVKKAAKSIKAATSKVTKAAAKAAQAVAKKIKELTTVNVDQNKVVSFGGTFGGNGNWKKIKNLFYMYKITWKVGVRFKLLIKTNSLKLTSASAFGSVDCNFYAKFSGETLLEGDAETTLYTQSLPTITFAIGIVPVVITNEIPLVAGYEYEFADNSWVTGALSVYGYLEAGFQYTNTNGFQLISKKEFKHSSSLDYALKMEFEGMAYMQLVYSGALYGLIVGSGIGQFDLELAVNSDHPTCGVKATIACGLSLMAGLEIELKILGFKIFYKDFGTKTLFRQRWPLANLCEKVAGTKGSYSTGSHHFHALESADSTSSSNLTRIDGDDSGMTWSATQDCGNGVLYEFAITGFFATANDTGEVANSTFPGSTLMLVYITRNVTNFSIPVNESDRFIYTTQRSFVGFDNFPSLGYAVRANTVTDPVFENFGVNLSSTGFNTDDNASSVTAFPQNVSYLNLQFGSSSITNVHVSVPEFCVSTISAASVNYTGRLPSPSDTLNEMLAIPILFPKPFAYTVRVALGLSLALAVASLLFVFYRRQNSAEAHSKFTAEEDHKKQWQFFVYLAVFVPTMILVSVLGLIGWSLNYATVDGMQVNTNETNPAASDNFLHKEWTFHWWYVDSTTCPQPSFCYPSCRDNCTKVTYFYQDAPWPYCPRNSDGSKDCSLSFPWTVALYASFAFLSGVACCTSLVVIKSSVKRSALSAFFAYVFALMVYLCRYRTSINVREGYLDYFATADEMVDAYQLSTNAIAFGCWNTMVAVAFILPGVSTIFLIGAVIAHEQKLKLRQVKTLEEAQEAVNSSHFFKESAAEMEGKEQPPEDQDQLVDEEDNVYRAAEDVDQPRQKKRGFSIL